MSMNKPSDEKRVLVQAETRRKRLKCLACDTEVLIYVPLDQADLVAECTPGYCANCLSWSIIEESNTVTSKATH